MRFFRRPFSCYQRPKWSVGRFGEAFLLSAFSSFQSWYPHKDCGRNRCWRQRWSHAARCPRNKWAQILGTLRYWNISRWHSTFSKWYCSFNTVLWRLSYDHPTINSRRFDGFFGFYSNNSKITWTNVFTIWSICKRYWHLLDRNPKYSTKKPLWPLTRTSVFAHTSPLVKRISKKF